MSKPDYKALGFKCGIEIHQQLDTHKLFCSCPSEIREDCPDYDVRRKMRAVSGEIGDVDPAALYEFLKDRTIGYEGYKDTTCLVELDEEPPHTLNAEALDCALEVAIMLKAKAVDEIQVMRKTVIDGSNTSGFQRTMLVATDGFVETEKGRVNIPTVCLEEDAARKIREENGLITYRLDRLGIPLVEIATDPDIKDPEHAREVAEKLGMILRATGKVKRGLGTIRQDLNASITGGERIEIKGVQDLRSIKEMLAGEVERQLMLLDAKKALEERGIGEECLEDPLDDITCVFDKTKSKLVENMLKKGCKVRGLRLRGFSGLLKNMLGPQMSQYAKSAAGVKGIFHSDELPGYGIENDELARIREKLGVGEYDAYALVVEKEKTAEKALEEVRRRAKLALKGVPKEVRRAGLEGKTDFMRPLPGSARMYPETDEPLIAITEERLGEIEKRLPEMPDAKKKRYMEMGLGEELANQLIRSRTGEDFDFLTGKYPRIKASIIANTLLSTPKEVKKRYGADTCVLGIRHFEEMLCEVSEGRISKDALPEVMAEASREPEKRIGQIVEEKKLGLMDEKELKALIEKTIKENLDQVNQIGPKAQGMLIGKIMAQTKGRADPEKVRRILEDKL